MDAPASAGPGASETWAVRTARLVSLVLHPFLVCPGGIVLVLWLDQRDLAAALCWAGLCALLVVLPAAAWLLRAMRQRRYTDADVSTRDHRYGFYVFGMVCMVLSYGILLWLGAPPLLQAGFMAAMVAVLVGALANRFWTKVSIHVGAMAGIAVVAALYSLPLALVLGALALVVAWGRVVLGRHTVAQTLAGCAVALVAVLAGFLPWL